MKLYTNFILIIIALFSFTSVSYSQFFFYKDFELLPDEFILDVRTDDNNLYVLTSEQIYNYRINSSQLDLVNKLNIPTKRHKRGIAGKINLANEIIENDNYFLLVSLNFLKGMILVSNRSYLNTKNEFFEITNSSFEDGEIRLKTRWASQDGFSLSGRDSYLVISKSSYSDAKSEISMPYQIPVDYYDACFLDNKGEKSLVVVDEEGFVRLYNMIGELISITGIPYGASLICKDIDNDSGEEIIITSSEDKSDQVIILRIEDKKFISKWESGKVDGRIIKLISYRNEIFGILEKGSFFKLFSLSIP